MPVLIWYFFLFFLMLQGFYVSKNFLPLLRLERKPKRIPSSVSVIICAKDEAAHLRENLPFILEQRYKDFEVLVMDDHSTDETKELIETLSKSHNKLRYAHASEKIKDKAGKKWALSEAIKKAKYDIILLTDADCKPSSLTWIEEMTSRIAGKTSIVLGIGQYEMSSKWFDPLIQYETLFTAMTYLGMAKRSRPYMGVGRNLAYKKSLFTEDLMTSSDLATGDDDLFVQKVANHENTAICTDQKAQTFSKAPESYMAWLKQKSRHYSAAIDYKNSVKISLLMQKMSLYLPNYLFLYLIASDFHIVLVSIIFFMRWLIWLILLQTIAYRMGFRHRLYFLPFYEIYFSLFDLWITTKSLRKERITWK